MRIILLSWQPPPLLATLQMAGCHKDASEHRGTPVKWPLDWFPYAGGWQLSSRWDLHWWGNDRPGMAFNINGLNSDGWVQITPARMVLVCIHQWAGAALDTFAPRLCLCMHVITEWSWRWMKANRESSSADVAAYSVIVTYSTYTCHIFKADGNCDET